MLFFLKKIQNVVANDIQYLFGVTQSCPSHTNQSWYNLTYSKGSGYSRRTNEISCG